MKKKVFFPVLFLLSVNITAQDYFRLTKDVLILDNGNIRREISTAGNRFFSSALIMPGMKENFISDSREFSFSLNDKRGIMP